MAVPRLMTAIGLVAVMTLAGPAASARAQEEPGGHGPLRVALQADTGEERLNPGDRVEYTIRVHNTGEDDLDAARVVHFLPETMSHVAGSGNVDPDGAQVHWDRPLEAGERSILLSTAQVESVPEDGSHSAATVCVRPEDGAAGACTAVDHRIHGAVPWTVVTAAGLLLLAVIVGAVGLLRYRDSRRPRPEPPTPSNHTPGSVPNVRTFPGAAKVYHLDVHR
ncbi:DUF11 domain-containing protein [Nocardiopsis sp. HNM0947]|uniref:DUF11 domain-containing protein n=1 Tax=Nocardiopsis coralli TaxID=2772213 RepID=A0ABR9P5L8_9ACTN|nr:DUF11 domain-containing protein [Nocardiopsis coralli]MBE2999119.1 DUF11 domain-containing protein [Nocardiopsis coralli]